MGQFVFEAKTMTGQTVKGEVEAANDAEVRVKLRAQRMTPLRVVPKHSGKPTFRAGKVRPKDLQVFTRQFATLLQSGVPVVQSLEAMGKTSASPALTNTLNRVVDDIGGGRRLGDAFAQHPGAFDRFYVNMVKAGEEGGVLDTVLLRLAEYIEKSVKLTGKIKGAMVYPAAIVFVAVIVVSIIMIVVIPKFETLFRSMKQDLPALTQMVVDLSRFFVSSWYFLLGGAVVAIAAAISYVGTPAGREMADKIMIRVPLIGAVIQKGGIARFSRTLSTLLGAGVGIMEAMEIGARVSGNCELERSFMRARDALSQGKSMTTTLSREKWIPVMVTQMIGIGEQTGALDTMLAKIADFYEEEVDTAVGALTSAMEPILMVVLGGIVGTLVIAMYLPIFNMANAIK